MNSTDPRPVTTNQNQVLVVPTLASTRTNSALSLQRAFADCANDAPTETALLELLHTLSVEAQSRLLGHWQLWARDDQLPPPLTGEGWRNWLVLGGRGAGKTRAGAEWVRAMALGETYATDQPARRIALVAETQHDARSVMVEGISGLMSVHAAVDRPTYEPSKGQLTWPNGSIAQLFSGDDPDGLRGPQFDAAWCDELAKWRHGLHTCPQQAWVSFHRTVRSFLDLPDSLMIYSGMALGYEDTAAPINGWRSPRAAVDTFASFDGFES